MAESNGTGCLEEDEDCDVIFEGSPLHEHLRRLGLTDEIESRNFEQQKLSLLEKQGHRSHLTPMPHLNPRGLLSKTQHLAWPKDCNVILEIEVAQKIMESELLVQEDQDFISNFILTEDAFVEYEKKVDENSGKSSSLFGDILLFSGSMAAVAGTILFLSERTRLATTVAAVLPTALAAFSTCRMNSGKVDIDKDKEQFLKLIDILLGDMKLFKQMVRKSLNLLQGMELLNAGYLVSVNKTTGAASAETRLTTSTNHFQRDSTFPALRQATYKCTVQLLEGYREALAKLMEVSPLADYIDMKDHYIAFVDLNCFGVENPSNFSDGETVSIKVLKETVQLSLVQQSEYLRRFSLVFCERVREEDSEFDKSGIINQIREMAKTLKTINTKLSRVFEYHQAMGINVEQKALSLKQKQLQFNFVPLRTLYTSLFSTGLHLQNSLLKVRQMENLFDALEKQKKNQASATAEISSLIPSEHQLIEWLKGFQDVQIELNACVGCLEDGVSQINVLKGEEDKDMKPDKMAVPQSEQVIQESPTKQPAKVIHLTDEQSEQDNFDQVFEAFVAEERCSLKTGLEDELCLDDGSAPISRHSNKFLMKELKQVLVGKAEEHRIREEKAIERQHKLLQNGYNGVSSNGDYAVPKCPDHLSISSQLSKNHLSEDTFPNKAKNEVSHSKVKQNTDQRVEHQQTYQHKNDQDLLRQQVQEHIQQNLKKQKPQHLDQEHHQQQANGKHSTNFNGQQDVDEELTGFEHFLDETSSCDQTSLVDPFCPDGTSANSGKNCFEDNFFCPAAGKTDLIFSSEDEDSAGSTSSSHPSTIRSVGRAVESCEVWSQNSGRDFSSCSTNSGGSDLDMSDNFDSKPEAEKVFGTRRKQLSKKKKRLTKATEGLNHSLPRIELEKSRFATSGEISSNNLRQSRICISEIRSLSTPDLKQLVSLSSPYVSLEDVSPKRDISIRTLQTKRTSSGSSSGSGSSDWGSMDELENYTLKTFQRPLRPAAHKKSQFKSRKSENSSTETENYTKGKENGDTKEREIHTEDVGVHKETNVKEKSLKNGSGASGTSIKSTMSSVYREKHGDQIQEIRQPTGFDSSLAAQVVARAQNFGKKFNFLQKEEVFGSD